VKYRTNIISFTICNDEDINKSDDEKDTVLLWCTSDENNNIYYGVYLEAFPIWYNEQKRKGHSFCMQIDGVGWYMVLLFLVKISNLDFII